MTWAQHRPYDTLEGPGAETHDWNDCAPEEIDTLGLSPRSLARRPSLRHWSLSQLQAERPAILQYHWDLGGARWGSRFFFFNF